MEDYIVISKEDVMKSIFVAKYWDFPEPTWKKLKDFFNSEHGLNEVLEYLLEHTQEFE